MKNRPEKTANKKTRRRLKVRHQVFLSMLLLVCLLIALLWAAQSLFLGPVHRWTRKNDVLTTSSRLEKIGDEDVLSSEAERMALSKGICVIVLSESGREIASSEGINNCAIHNITRSGLGTLAEKARGNGGSYLQTFVRDEYRSSYVALDPSRDESSLNGTESIIYVKIAPSPDGSGQGRIFFLNAVLTPVGSTVSATHVLLLLISIPAVVASLLLALFLAGRIARPVVSIRDKVGRLAGGDYSIDFVSGGARELTELGAELNRTEKELGRVDRLQKELVANISHDLRTPLTLITGYTEMMRDIPGENTPENLQTVLDEAGRLSSLVNDVLDLSKLRAGARTPEKTVFDLSSSVAEEIDRYARFARRKGYRILLNAPVSCPVRADRTLLTQAVYNLVNNAVTYTGEDKTVSVSVFRDGDEVRCEVTDSGEGIPPDKLENIWERYYKVDPVHKRSAEGSGLGLSIVREIMELHGGRYGVITSPGKGSTFWFSLPASPLG